MFLLFFFIYKLLFLFLLPSVCIIVRVIDFFLWILCVTEITFGYQCSGERKKKERKRERERERERKRKETLST